MNIKKKHHFVSQFYLKAWCTDDNKITVWNGSNNFQAKTETIGYQKNLYKINNLTLKQIDCFMRYAKALNFLNLSTYKMVIIPILDTQKAFKLVNSAIDKIHGGNNNDRKKQVDDMKNIQKEFSSNIIEDKFSLEEAKFSKILKEIISCNKLDFNLNDYDVLIHFFASQLARTPKKINKIKIIEEDIIKKYDFTNDDYHTFSLYVLMCFTETVYLSCLTRLDQIKIYINISDVNFITSDDPSFNQKMDEKKLFIQIPISPKVMIELSQNSSSSEYIRSMRDYYVFHKENADKISVTNTLITHHEISREEVIDLNNKIFTNRDQFIYVHALEDIKHIKSDEILK